MSHTNLLLNMRVYNKYLVICKYVFRLLSNLINIIMKVRYKNLLWIVFKYFRKPVYVLV